MRGVCIAVAVASLAACQKAQAPQLSATSSQPAAGVSAQPAAAAVSGIEGWETGRAAYPLLGATLPGFKAKRLGGGEMTEGDLREHWTILGLWNGSSEAAKGEMRYIGALNSAANQDPNLDFQSVYLADGGDFDVQKWGAGASAWPTVIGDAALADTFGIASVPAYLLIGPDLTVEAYRGALAKTPDDGVKSVIRGVAEIKKQIAAPE